MAGRIRNADVEQVRERAQIADIVSEHLTLRQAGHGSLKGLCPFHEERTPSFHVTPAKGLYYCFGCGAGGDAIDFLMQHDHLSFVEAVEKLAGATGVTLRYEGGAPAGPARGSRANLIAVNRAAATFFRDQLASPEAETARQLLEGKGFDPQDAERFGVGYAPRSGLQRYLRDQGYANRDIIDAGLIAQGDHGWYDRFRERVMWPIRDVSGDVVGFGGRRLGDKGAKYLNTPETDLYKKSQILFGLFEAKREIASSQQAVVVEGYTDVMACHAAGITNAVATCGTAFGTGHVNVLRRVLLDDPASQIIFSFDGDEAGQRAAIKAYSEHEHFEGVTYVCVEPSGLDPCDLRLQRGDEALRELVAGRRPLLEFVLRTELDKHDLGSPAGRARAASATLPVLRDLKDPILASEYAREVAGWLGVDPQQLQAQLDGAAERSTNQPRNPDTNVEASLEREVLRVLVQEPQLVTDWWANISADAFTSSMGRRVYEAVAQETPGGDERVRIAAILEGAADDKVRDVIRALAVEPLPVQQVDEGYAVGVVARLLDRQAERESASLRAALAQGLSGQEEVDVLADLMELEHYRRSLRRHWAGEE